MEGFKGAFTPFLLYTGTNPFEEAAMLIIEKVDTSNKAQVKRFVEFPYQLYKNAIHALQSVGAQP